MDAVADRLNASTEQLARMMERERHFSANASHQLRTALTALRIPLEELVAGRRPDQVRQLTDLIVHQADRLQATIEDLLALAHGQRRRLASAFAVDAVVAERGRGVAAGAWRATVGRLELVRRVGALARAPGDAAAGARRPHRQCRRHGAGDVTRRRSTSTAGSPVVRVSDEGPGIADGLRAAHLRAGHEPRATAAASAWPWRATCSSEEGGRLVLARARPAVFEVFLARVERDRTFAGRRGGRWPGRDRAIPTVALSATLGSARSASSARPAP